MSLDAVKSVSNSLKLDIEEMQKQVGTVLAEKLFWFPVRHHSPSVSRYLIEAIKERKPKIVFIEGPTEAESLIPYLVERATKPPVAIYSSYRDDANSTGLAGIITPSADIPARFSAWYPFLSYSPEYAAMKLCAELGIKTVFMDLPHYIESLMSVERAGFKCQQDQDDIEQSQSDDDRGSSEEQEDAKAGQTTEPPNGPGPEGLIADSLFYKILAEAAGYRTWDEAWDTMFEIRDFRDIEHFRSEFALFCAAVRATLPAESLLYDGTIDRERHMIERINKEIAASGFEPEQCMVVCGGMHLFLERDPEPQPWPDVEGNAYSTIVPYSFFRISELSGYGAGNRAPRFYQTVWESSVQGNGADSTTLGEHIVSILKEARKLGDPLSSADAIAISQHAELLSRLRGRSTPILDDIHDAVVTCCCKGDPEEDGVNLRRAIDAADVGVAVGRVTSKLGNLPIVADFYNMVEALELTGLVEAEHVLTVNLDKREDLDSRRSAFLSQLLFLGVPVGGKTGSASMDFDTGKIFAEQWKVKWDPKVEARLIEQTLLGDTIRSAAITKLQDELASSSTSAGKLCRILLRTIDMDLPELVKRVHEACGASIDDDSRFLSLCDALRSLLVLDKYADLRELSRDTLVDLIQRCFHRACFSILDVVSAPEEQQSEICTAMLSLSEALLRGNAYALDRDLFVEHVQQACEVTDVPFLRGVFFGMLVELRERSSDDLAEIIVGLTQSHPEKMVSAGELLHGVMSISKTSILIGAESLISAVDQLLKSARWEEFLNMLPGLRGAFEELHAGQVSSIAKQVAQRYGLEEAETLTEFVTSSAVALQLARIDLEVQKIMKDWEF